MQLPNHVFVGVLLLVGLFALCTAVLPSMKQAQQDGGLIVVSGQANIRTAPQLRTTESVVAQVAAFAATRQTHYELPLDRLDELGKAHAITVEWREVTSSNYDVAILSFGNKAIYATQERIQLRVGQHTVSLDRPRGSKDWIRVGTKKRNDVHTLTLNDSYTIEIQSDEFATSEKLLLNNVTATGKSRGHAIFSNLVVRVS